MDASDLEDIAVDTYRRHGFAPDRPTSAYRLIRKAHGANAITRPPTLLTAYPAARYQVRDEPRFALRRTVPDDEAQFYLYHELAHLLLGTKHGVAGDDIERTCDYLAAALIAPRPAVRALYRAFGWDLAEIADEVVATQTWAALRLGETLQEPVATVGPLAVRTRGPEAWAWPTESELRRIAGAQARQGITKIRVTDRPKRVVLLCAGA